jgi:hypothetical protein
VRASASGGVVGAGGVVSQRIRSTGRVEVASLVPAKRLEASSGDEHLISRFELLRHGARESLSTPRIYMVFHVLQQEIRISAMSLFTHVGRCWRAS